MVDALFDGLAASRTSWSPWWRIPNLWAVDVDIDPFLGLSHFNRLIRSRTSSWRISAPTWDRVQPCVAQAEIVSTRFSPLTVAMF